MNINRKLATELVEEAKKNGKKMADRPLQKQDPLGSLG